MLSILIWGRSFFLTELAFLVFYFEVTDLVRIAQAVANLKALGGDGRSGKARILCGQAAFLGFAVV
jgi:hypothetical protein